MLQVEAKPFTPNEPNNSPGFHFQQGTEKLNGHVSNTQRRCNWQYRSVIKIKANFQILKQIQLLNPFSLRLRN